MIGQNIQGIKSIVWEAKITRANGDVEDLGVISRTDSSGLDDETMQKLIERVKEDING